MKLVDPKTEMVGARASVLSAVVCLGFGVWDLRDHHRIWVYWMVFSVLLLVNGLAMFHHAHKARTAQGSGTKHATA